MVHSVTGNSSLNPLFGPRDRHEVQQNDLFEHQLQASVTEALGKIGVAPDRIHVQTSTSGVQTISASMGERQFFVTVAQPEKEPARVSDRQSQQTATAAELPPLDVLGEALRAVGIDPEALHLSESTDTVSYPGGTYTNHLIAANFGDGSQERYSVDLMLRNPRLTVLEIARQMGRPVPFVTV